jgi:hypothetical protein
MIKVFISVDGGVATVECATGPVEVVIVDLDDQSDDPVIVQRHDPEVVADAELERRVAELKAELKAENQSSRDQSEGV